MLNPDAGLSHPSPSSPGIMNAGGGAERGGGRGVCAKK